MTHIKYITVRGISALGAFEGTLPFDNGLSIISGPNGFGKSTALKAIAWCLGLEVLYNVSPGDPSFMPACESADLGTERNVRVRSAEAILAMERTDGASLTVKRIIGVGVLVVDVVHRSPDGTVVKQGSLKLGHGSMSLEHAGFQRFLFDWLGIPILELTRKQGGHSPIYLENLAALFFIEQLEGWMEVQSKQVFKFGTTEIAEGSIELLLGLEAHLEMRRLRQENTSSEAKIRDELNAVLGKYEEVIREIGQTDPLRISGSLSEILRIYDGFSLVNRVREKLKYDFKGQREHFQEVLERLRRQLTHGSSAADDGTRVSQVAEISQRLVSAKARRSKVFERLAELRAQVRQLERVEEDLSARIHASQDLLRLKKSGIGILPSVECPTCGQLVSPEILHLENHQANDVEIHGLSLERELKTILRKKSSLVLETQSTSVELRKIEAEYEDTSRALQLINQTVDPLRESLVKISTDIIRYEKMLDLNIRVWRRLGELQTDWDREFSQAKGLHGNIALNLGAEEELLRSFKSELGRLLWALRHNAVQQNDVGAVDLDSKYNPYLRNRNLQILGSASDRARLIIAYVWALASVAQRHPGVVILDEPLQQNPDRLHVEHLVQFLISQRSLKRFQAIVVTYLPDEVVAGLREAGVRVNQLEPGKRFLNLLGHRPPEDRL